MSRLLPRLAALLIASALAAPAAAAEAPALVDAAWLAANLDRPELIVLDVRFGPGDAAYPGYFQGHVPGAIHSDYLADGWRTRVDGVVGQLPPVPALEVLTGSLGIGNDNHVVIVAPGASAADMASATRVYFTFKVLGHDAVSVLDGGYRAWAADPARPVETGSVTRPATTFAADFRPELLADRDEVAAARAAGTALLDIRPPEQYLGRAKSAVARVAGTIPGALSLPEGSLTENGGTLVSKARAVELLAQIGVTPDGEAITFCNTGHWASLGWFVSHEILGNENVRLYDGSMADWSADPARPVEIKAN